MESQCEFSELVCDEHICFSSTRRERMVWFECGRICSLESSFMLIRHIPKYVDGIHLFAYTQISLFAMIPYIEC